METNLSVLIPRVSKLSQKFDNTSLILSHHWVLVDEINSKKKLYIFRDNNELIISDDGCVDTASWRYLGKNTLLIEQEKVKKLYKHGFFDQNLIAIKTDVEGNYSFFVNEEKFNLGLNSENKIGKYLYSKYLNNTIKKKVTRRKRKSIRNKKNSGFYNYNFNYNYEYNVLDKINNKSAIRKFKIFLINFSLVFFVSVFVLLFLQYARLF
ncbi:hypothetical protein OAT36_04620 [Flavobacteriaceae bacterium]|nr:hypothetical protein [Flavobacteriaceae bacterium]MDC1168174.1 hypothetical protein [Flavobacteriaceae bacterium]